MPQLVRTYITQVFIGFGLSAVFVSALLYLDVAGLWHLVTHTQGGAIAVGMLFMFNGLVFAGVQFAMTIMRMAGTDTPPKGGRKMPIAMEPALVPVKARK